MASSMPARPGCWATRPASTPQFATGHAHRGTIARQPPQQPSRSRLATVLKLGLGTQAVVPRSQPRPLQYADDSSNITSVDDIDRCATDTAEKLVYTQQVATELFRDYYQLLDRGHIGNVIQNYLARGLATDFGSVTISYRIQIDDMYRFAISVQLERVVAFCGKRLPFTPITRTRPIRDGFDVTKLMAFEKDLETLDFFQNDDDVSEARRLELLNEFVDKHIGMLRHTVESTSFGTFSDDQLRTALINATPYDEMFPDYLGPPSFDQFMRRMLLKLTNERYDSPNTRTQNLVTSFMFTRLMATLKDLTSDALAELVYQPGGAAAEFMKDSMSQFREPEGPMPMQ